MSKKTKVSVESSCTIPPGRLSVTTRIKVSGIDESSCVAVARLLVALLPSNEPGDSYVTPAEAAAHCGDSREPTDEELTEP